MNMSRRSRVRLCLAVAAGLTATFVKAKIVHAQQNPNDPVITLNANDSTGVSSFFGGPTYQWSNGTAPVAGNAYVVTGSAAGTGQLRTPTVNTSPITFGGDSLTIIPYDGQANLYGSSTTAINAQDTTAGLFIEGTTSGQTINIPDLILGNGGAIIGSSQKPTIINGSIDLLPVNTTIDGITTTENGGIFDVRYGNGTGFTLNATLTGTGQLQVISTGSTGSQSALNLNGSNSSFSGGILLDNTVGTGTSAGSGSFPLLNINNAGALGTGTFTIGSNDSSGTTVGAGPTINNLSGNPLTLSTITPQQWNGNFQFTGTNSLNMGSGAVTLGNNVTFTGVANLLAVNSVTGNYTLTIYGGTNAGSVYGGLEIPQFSSINATSVIVASGETLAFSAMNMSAAQLSAVVSNAAFTTNSNALLGIDTTGVSGPVSLTTGLSNGSYGINKVGSGTLLLGGTNAYTGFTVISAGTLMLGNANALGVTSAVNFGANTGVTANGTLDVNGFNATIPGPNGGAPTAISAGGLITNSSPTPATITIVPASAFISNSTFFGNITGNLGVTIAYPALTSNSTTYAYANLYGTNTYTGATTLQSGVMELASIKNIPSNGTSQIVFSGGILYLGSSGIDPSATFSQASNQLYNIAVNVNTDALGTSLNSAGGSLVVGSLNGNLAGNGILALTAPNNYNGSTNILSGTLQLANAKAVAGTSGITVNSTNTGTMFTPTYVSSTLQINDSSGVLGLTGGVSGGAPLLLSLNGIGATSTVIQYSTGFGLSKKYYTTGYAYYGALEGIAGGTDIWAGTVDLNLNGSSGTPVGISGGYNNATTGGKLILTGQITGSGPLLLGLNANSVTVLGASNSYSGETQLMSSTGVASTVQLGANFGIPSSSGLNFTNNNAELAASASFVYGTTTFDLNGYNTSTAYVTSTSTSTYTGITTNATSNNGLITNTKNGSTSTLTIVGGTAGAPYLGQFQDGSTTAKLGLAFTVSGVFDFNGGSNYSGGTAVNSGNLVISGLSNAGSGSLIVNGGEMVIQSSSTATAATIFSMLHNGFNGGAWNGSGVSSLTAASDTTHLTAVGMLTGSTENFEGQGLNSTDVALKLTYYGDANLDGKVDGSDYSLIDYAYLNNQNSSNLALTGWQNGDFNYDGVINGSDYTLIDNAFNSQGTQFSAEIASPTAQVAGSPESSPVPEPTALGLLAVGATALLGRRRK